VADLLSITCKTIIAENSNKGPWKQGQSHRRRTRQRKLSQGVLADRIRQLETVEVNYYRGHSDVDIGEN